VGKNNRDDKYTVFTEILPYLLELKRARGIFYFYKSGEKH
jgi:hypothetical protein